MTQLRGPQPSGRPFTPVSEPLNALGSLHVATLNVKFDGDRDQPVPIPTTGHVPSTHGPLTKYAQRPWAERRSRIVDALLSSGPPDIVGFQEVYHSQLLDLSTLLGDTYAHVGVGRDDGQQAGEYSPIFYDQVTFDLVDWTTKWLSPTPDVPGSKGWGANLTRIATFLTLRARDSGELVHVVNTHYDDGSGNARAESSFLIRQLVFEWVDQQEGSSSGGEMRGPVILLGDLNSPPEEEGYQNLTSHSPLPSGNPSFAFLDAFVHLQPRGSSSEPRQSAPYGPLYTFTDFQPPGYWNAKRIDFVMIAGGDDEVASEGWQITGYACVDNMVEGDADGWVGRWSDHRIVRVILERT